jgi:TonB-dependent Receptor Plug Domain.
MFVRIRRASSNFAAFLIFASSALHAQSTAGRLSGSVTDPSGAAVPEVRVVAVNSETGQKITEKTTVQGQFVVYPLPPGLYDVTIKKEGFNTFTISGLKIDVSQSAIRNISLEVGTTTQSVSVSTEAAVIETESPSIQSTITRRQIEELPLNGRDFNQLVLLSAGSVDNNVGGGTDFGSVALNGNRTYGNGYLVDGMPNNNSFQGTSAAPLSIDLIREFKVISGVAPAEYGQGGAQISVVTQGGTNNFHGISSSIIEAKSCRRAIPLTLQTTKVSSVTSLEVRLADRSCCRSTMAATARFSSLTMRVIGSISRLRPLRRFHWTPSGRAISRRCCHSEYSCTIH